MTNVLFVTFYYAFIFPAGYFFAAATLAVHYWVDKFCLLRIWRPAPMLGSEIADTCRIYFFSFAIAVLAVMSSYNYASFPYDNACCKFLNVRHCLCACVFSNFMFILIIALVDESTAPSDYVGNIQAVTAAGTSVQAQVSQGDPTYFYCNQDMMHYIPPAFPAIPSNQPEGGEWMSSSQDFCSLYGWTSLVIVCCVLGIFLNALRKRITPIFFRVYEVSRCIQQCSMLPFSQS